MNIIIYFTDKHNRYLEEVDEIIQNKHRIIFSSQKYVAEYDTRKITNVVINDFIQERMEY